MGSKLPAYIAFACTCFFWGTTYLALSFGLDSLPPFFISGSRQAISGLLILSWFIARRKAFPCFNDLKRILISGFIIVLFSNAIVTWALQYVPSGLTGLLFTLVPVFVVMINIFLVKKERINLFTIAGLVLGFAGFLLVFNLQLPGKDQPWGIIALLAGIVAWAFGTVFTKDVTERVNPLLVAGIQLLVFGLLTDVISLAVEDLSLLRQVSSRSLLSVSYLIIFDSIVGYGCYLYALSKLSSSFVSLYAYISPLIALFLGWLFRDESLDMNILLAVAAIFSGVFLVNRGIMQSREPGKGAKAY
jgi:drug/metabolite transporter (DMT)-like permease